MIFDFVCFIDGAPVNRGAEAWQLVKGADGWRILALTLMVSSRAIIPPRTVSAPLIRRQGPDWGKTVSAAA